MDIEDVQIYKQPKDFYKSLDCLYIRDILAVT